MHVLLLHWLVKATHLLHYIWESVVCIKWRLDGTASRIDAIICGEVKDQPAQVLRVIWTNPLLMNGHATPQTYFTVHERFAPAEIVLNNRMHLLSVNSKAATFTEVDTDILDVRKHPFTYMAQTNHTTRLIILPIESFYELANNLDVDDRRVVWMFHTSRCGSTAWVQAFSSLPDWTVFSEPQAVICSIVYGDHEYHSAESYSKTAACKQLVVAVIKMHVQHAPPGGSMFWKATAIDEHFIETIASRFPQHQMLVAYRDSFPSITSFYRSFYKIDYLRYTAETTLNHDPSDEKWWFHLPNPHVWTNGCDHNFCKKLVTDVRPKTCLEWYCFLWAAKAAAIRCALRNGVRVRSINYDSLLENRRSTVEQVFNYLDLPAHYVDIACETLKSDSQGGVEHVSWDTRAKGDAAEWSKDPDVVKRCNMILEAFDLPDLHSSMEFPN